MLTSPITYAHVFIIIAGLRLPTLENNIGNTLGLANMFQKAFVLMFDCYLINFCHQEFDILINPYQDIFRNNREVSQ